MKLLKRIEEILLIAIYKLQDEAYGITIREQVEKDTGENWIAGAIYAPLNRLRKNGYVKAHQAEGPAELGGRPRIYYKLTPLGLKKLISIQKINQALWDHIPDLEKKQY